MSDNYFEKLSKVDVKGLTEKKGKLDYLSWSHAVKELKTVYPKSYWIVEEYDGKPFMKTEEGYFVKVTVTVEGVSQAQIHPVFDNSFKALANPTACQINTSIQRCLAKAIALHGIGIDVFSGEDLPGHDAIQNTSSQLSRPSIPPSVEVDIAYQDIRPSGDLTCPTCKKGKLMDNGPAIGCSNWNNPTDKCGFKSIFKNGSPLCLDDMKDVLSGKETRVLTMQKKSPKTGTYQGVYFLNGDGLPEFKFYNESTSSDRSYHDSTEEKGPEQKIFESPF